MRALTVMLQTLGLCPEAQVDHCLFRGAHFGGLPQFYGITVISQIYAKQTSTEKTWYFGGRILRAYLDRTMSSVTEANIDKESTGQDDADDEHADEEQ